MKTLVALFAFLALSTAAFAQLTVNGSTNVGIYVQWTPPSVVVTANPGLPATGTIGTPTSGAYLATCTAQVGQPYSGIWSLTGDPTLSIPAQTPTTFSGSGTANVTVSCSAASAGQINGVLTYTLTWTL